MKKLTLSKLLTIFLNILITVFVITGTIIISKRDGWATFKWYTVLSNVFCGISSIIFLVYLAKTFNGKSEIPSWVFKIRYAATCTVTLTFIVVIAVLAPQRGPGGHKEMMLESFGLYLHTLAPIFSILSFMLVEKNEVIFKDSFIAIFPTFLYAIVCIILNCLKVLEGPYFFLNVKKLGGLKICMWVVILSAAAFLINYLLYLIHKLVTKK